MEAEVVRQANANTKPRQLLALSMRLVGELKNNLVGHPCADELTEKIEVYEKIVRNHNKTDQ